MPRNIDTLRMRHAVPLNRVNFRSLIAQLLTGFQQMRRLLMNARIRLRLHWRSRRAERFQFIFGHI
jgi:hypothetical protein